MKNTKDPNQFKEIDLVSIEKKLEDYAKTFLEKETFFKKNVNHPLALTYGYDFRVAGLFYLMRDYGNTIGLDKDIENITSLSKDICNFNNNLINNFITQTDSDIHQLLNKLKDSFILKKISDYMMLHISYYKLINLSTLSTHYATKVKITEFLEKFGINQPQYNIVKDITDQVPYFNNTFQGYPKHIKDYKINYKTELLNTSDAIEDIVKEYYVNTEILSSENNIDVITKRLGECNLSKPTNKSVKNILLDYKKNIDSLSTPSLLNELFIYSSLNAIYQSFYISMKYIITLTEDNIGIIEYDYSKIKTLKSCAEVEKFFNTEIKNFTKIIEKAEYYIRPLEQLSAQSTKNTPVETDVKFEGFLKTTGLYKLFHDTLNELRTHIPDHLDKINDTLIELNNLRINKKNELKTLENFEESKEYTTEKQTKTKTKKKKHKKKLKDKIDSEEKKAGEEKDQDNKDNDQIESATNKHISIEANKANDQIESSDINEAISIEANTANDQIEDATNKLPTIQQMFTTLMGRVKKLQEILQTAKSNSMNNNNNQIEEVKESKVVEKKVITKIKSDIKAEPKSIVKYGTGYIMLSSKVLNEITNLDSLLNQFKDTNLTTALKGADVLHFSPKGTELGDFRPYLTTILKYNSKIILNLFEKSCNHQFLNKASQSTLNIIEISKDENNDLIQFIETYTQSNSMDNKNIEEAKISDTFDNNH